MYHLVSCNITPSITESYEQGDEKFPIWTKSELRNVTDMADISV